MHTLKNKFKQLQIEMTCAYFTKLQRLFHDFGSCEGPITDKNRHVLTTLEVKKNRSVEHFQEILNGPAPQDKVYFSKINEMDALNIQMEAINKTEVIHAIRNTKDNKAAGEDKITIEC